MKGVSILSGQVKFDFLIYLVDNGIINVSEAKGIIKSGKL